MKTKITLLKSVAFTLLFVQATLCAATPVKNSMLYAMPNFAPATAIIMQQPQSVNICEGQTAQFTVTVVPTGQEPVYIWSKNGATIYDSATVSGTASPTLTITNVSERDAAQYTCLIFDGSMGITTAPAYLNAAITAENSATTCEAAPTVISVEATGETTKYQWYSNTTNTNTGGTPIAGETNNFYYPTTLQEGSWYFYVVVYPEGFEECAAITSNPIAINVGETNAGIASQNQIVCPDSPAALSITNSFGEIKWQQSTDGTDNWTNVTSGIGANTANYTTPNLTTSMFYRAEVGNFTCGIKRSDVIAVTVTQTYTWTGAAGTNWNNTANWACSIVPTLNENVLIPAEPGNQPVIETGIAYAKTLTIENGASVTVLTGKTLHVEGSINVAGTASLKLQNNASLIQDNDDVNTGVITVIKNSNPLYRLDYTMWSSPVAGQQLQAFSPETVAGRFYEYKYDMDEGTQTPLEQYFQVNPATNFEAAKAYLIRMPNGHTTPGYNTGLEAVTYAGTFTGAPHNGTKVIEASVVGNRYTAVGNPYPSPISLTDFFDQNELVLQEDSAIYLWRKRNDSTATSYATLTKAGCVANDAVGGGHEQVDFYTGDDNESWILSQGQGFIVKTAQTPSTTNIVFANNMRRPAATQQGFFRTGQPQASRLWLNLTANHAFSQAAVAYINGATTGIDYGYDGERLNEGHNTTLYTLAQNKNLAIQARPSFNDQDVVSLGFVATVAGEYTIAIDHTEGVFNNGQTIYLKDNLLNSTTPLNTAYTFTSQEGTFNTRFEIVYVAQESLGNNNPMLDNNSVIVYKDNSGININSAVANMTSINVYDMGGRTLYTKNNISTTQLTVAGLQAQQQVLIIEINTEKGKTSKKIVF